MNNRRVSESLDATGDPVQSVDEAPRQSAAGLQLLPIVDAPPLAPEHWQLYHLADTPGDRSMKLEDAFGEIEVAEGTSIRFSANADFALSNPQQLLYGIVDAATDMPAAIAAKQAGCDPVSLFVGERAWELLEVAAYLVRMPAGTPYLPEWNAKLGSHVGVLFDSPASAEEIFVHLRGIFIVRDEAGEEYFFRYYDPRVLNTYLPTCTPDELREFFGPIRAWISENNDGDAWVAYTIDEKGLLAEHPLGIIEIAATNSVPPSPDGAPG